MNSHAAVATFSGRWVVRASAAPRAMRSRYRSVTGTDVRNVVLPDDAEETGEVHPWAWLTQHLGALGVETTPEELVNLPYDVVLSRRLRSRLSATG